MANTRKDNPNKVQRVQVAVPNKIARRIHSLSNLLQVRKDANNK